jgi:RNA polymerase sigma-70 factor, ECF subfamily
VDSDEHLFERIRAGDLAAFDRLYERYEVRLFAYLRALCGNRQDAEELLHDAFLAALRTSERSTFEPGAFCGFLYRVARNLAFNRRRAAQRHDRLLSSVPDPDAEAAEARPSVTTAADSAIERRELEEALAEAVGRLPLALGELYHLRSNGLSYEQIAAVIEAPLGTVKSRMHQMVNVLREELKPWIAPQ